MSDPGILDVRGVPPYEADLARAVDHLRAGGVLAYPTETVYGFGGLCTPDAVERVRALKRREADKPLLLLIRGPEDADGLVWTEEALELASVFWPGALTLVLADREGLFPPGVRSESGGVAVRVSPHPLVSALLQQVGVPLTSTSANEPGRPPARTGGEAAAAAAALDATGSVLVIDGGTLPPSSPSTIVDCTGAAPVVLRAGSVPLNRLRCALPEIHGR